MLWILTCRDDKCFKPDDFPSSSVSLDLAADIKLSDKLDEATITPNEMIDLTAVDKPILNSNTKILNANQVWV